MAANREAARSRGAAPPVAERAALPPFVFALAPTVASQPAALPERMAPLADYLEAALGRPVFFAVESTYRATVAGLRAGRIDAAMLGEYATRGAEAGGGVEPLLARVGSDSRPSTYQSAIVARIDSGIHDLSALAGATLGLVDERSTTGYLVPRAMLREAGLDPDRDLSTRLFGQHQAVVEAVIRGEVAAGACHAGRLAPPSLEQGPDYARLRVLARSQPVPLGPLVVREGLSAELRHRLTEALLRIHEVDATAARVLIRHGHRFTLAARRTTPTLKSIAELAGVSYATVSRVINGAGDVAPATAARVRAIVEELDYRPNGNALSLQGHQRPLVGLVTPAGNDPAVEALVARLQPALAEAGVPLVLCPSAGPLVEELYLELLRDGRFGGLVVTPAHAEDAGLAAVARTGRPVVAVGVARAVPGAVTASPEQAARALLGALGLGATTASIARPQPPDH